ncbi:hypothetical protein [Streptomyces sp. Tu6071]|uniref:hypothetical protein n=1 Tax=Streptomyces sp. Tu6071 TaxID=355249 RepID=UPI0005BAFE2D|nr:hypothetical protein [Streptomyces sp. Tu6071]
MSDLSPEEMEMLRDLTQEAGLVKRAKGRNIKTAQSLIKRGLAEWVNDDSRRWSITWTDAGKVEAEKHKAFYRAPTVNTESCTAKAHAALGQQNERAGSFTERWESVSLNSLEEFTKDAKDILRDFSEMRGHEIDAVNFLELLNGYRNIMDLPLVDGEGGGERVLRPVYHVRDANRIVGYFVSMPGEPLTYVSNPSRPSA